MHSSLLVPGPTGQGSKDEPRLDDRVRSGRAGCLGLRPETSIRPLLRDALPDPARARGIPRSEVYLVVERALLAGAVELSPLTPRDWGHLAAYSLDQLAFSAPTSL